jgi:D-3-phosphoglycerate dehydrogenase
MPIVAVTDFTFPSLDVEARIFAPLDVDLLSGQCKTPESLIPLVRDADAVLTQFAPVNAQVIAAMRKARVIVRYGIGVDNVDVEAARAGGIPVCNVPDYCIDEVADHTLAFILGLTRQVVAHTRWVQDGRWGLAVGLDSMRALRDMTVGIVGFGRIGREVASRLKPFKCRIQVHDPIVPAHEIKLTGSHPVSLDDLFADSDLVTLHCPSTPQTRGLISARALAGMKPGVLLVNLSRGDLIDSAALISSLESGHVSAAALDVFAPEPIPASHPILGRSNVILSPHIASTSPRAVRTLRESAAAIILKALQGEPLPNVVNGL